MYEKWEKAYVCLPKTGLTCLISMCVHFLIKLPRTDVTASGPWEPGWNQRGILGKGTERMGENIQEALVHQVSVHQNWLQTQTVMCKYLQTLNVEPELMDFISLKQSFILESRMALLSFRGQQAYATLYMQLCPPWCSGHVTCSVSKGTTISIAVLDLLDHV